MAHLTLATVTGGSFGATININAFRRSCGIVLALTTLLVQRPASLTDNIHAERGGPVVVVVVVVVGCTPVWRLARSQRSSWPSLADPRREHTPACVTTAIVRPARCSVAAEYSAGR